MSLPYFEKPQHISPHVIHALANLGTRTFHNEVFQIIKRTFDPINFSLQMHMFEGMITPPLSHSDTMRIREAMKKELPFLEMAISSTAQMQGTPQDREMAKAEYLTAKGEIYHALAHYNGEDLALFGEFSQKASGAFYDAINLLDQSEAKETSVGKDLHSKLYTQKAPHLLEKTHTQYLPTPLP